METPQSLLLSGFGLHRAGRLDEAATAYRRALVLDPALFNALNLLGVCERASGRTEAAVDLLRRSVRLNPAFPDSRQNLANALCAAGLHAEAIGHLRLLTGQRPEWWEGAFLLGVCLCNTDQPSAAIPYLRQALAARPDDPQKAAALSNAYLTAFDPDHFGEALRLARRVNALEPDRSLGYFLTALALSELGDFDASTRSCRRSLLLNSGDTDMLHIIGVNEISMGRAPEGFAGIEFRKNNTARTSSRYWDGRPLPDGALSLAAEGGFGDMFQFIRFVPQAARLCRRVNVRCPPALVHLLATAPHPGNVVFNAPDDDAQAFAPFLSLPHLLGGTREILTVPTPYLAADPARVLFWADRLAPIAGLRVGVFWNNGSHGRPADPRRSVPFGRIRALALIPGVRLVNLHKPDAATRALTPEADAGLLHDLGPDFDAGPLAFRDTAAVVANLDLVISIDSAAAHLAAALGRPVWLPLFHRADWRWMNDAETTPWYPTMRLFRQPAWRDWDGVFQRIGEELRRLAEGGAGRDPSPS